MARLFAAKYKSELDLVRKLRFSSVVLCHRFRASRLRLHIDRLQSHSSCPSDPFQPDRYMTDPDSHAGKDPLPPTRTRLLLVGWLCALAAILYLDRNCMSQALKPIQDELGISKTDSSYALMAFTLAYGLFAVPIGRMGDRIGSRAVLAGIVVGWSVFTALTGAATGLTTLIVVRFFFGATEAGAYPNTARVISRWFPVEERGRVQGLMLAATQFGGVIAPTAAAYLIDAAGWRWTFAAFAMLGWVWAVGFWRWFRDDPAEHPAMNTAELAIIRANAPPPPADPGPVPWRAVLTNRGILFLSIIMALGSFYTYFFYSWFSNYLQNACGLDNLDSGRLSSLVLAGSAVGVLVGGWLADRFPQWFADPIWARRVLGVGCYSAAAVLLFIAVRCDEPIALAALCSASFCVMHLTLPNWWSVIIPQSGRHVGTIFGLANGLGVFGAMTSQGFVGVFADWQKSRGFTGREQWDPVFDVYVGVLLLGAVAWWLYRFRPLEEEPTEHVTSISGSE
jgi:ACS family glucarate transporter-like MFS transporter